MDRAYDIACRLCGAPVGAPCINQRITTRVVLMKTVHAGRAIYRGGR